jgi:hypothetical protein
MKASHFQFRQAAIRNATSEQDAKNSTPVMMRRRRALSRQSGDLKPKNPEPSPSSLLRLIFSAVAFVSSYIPVVDLAARVALKQSGFVNLQRQEKARVSENPQN